MDTLRSPIIILIAIAVGILLRQLTGCGPGEIAIAFGLAFISYASTKILARKKGISLRVVRLHYVWISLFFISLGATSDYVFAYRYPVEGRHFVVGQRARIIDDVAKNTGDLLTVELLNLGCKATVLTPPTPYGRGDLVVIEGPLMPVDSLRKPIVNTYGSRTKSTGWKPALLAKPTFLAKPSVPAKPTSLAKQGILYTGYAPKSKIRKVGRSATLMTFAGDVRDRLESLIIHTGLSRETKDFLITLMLGDKQFLDRDLRQTFSDVGLSHVLAVSGLHTGIIASIFLAFLFPFDMIGRRKWKFVLSIILLWVFVFVTGFAASTVRAAIMMTALFVGFLIERRIKAGTALCWAGIFILLLMPSALFDPGFQLSFLCVASLTIFCERLNPFDLFTHRRLYLATSTLLATLVSTACTWIVVAYYFGSVPTLFLPANLLILPFVPFYIGGSLLYFLLYAFGIEAVWIGRGLDYALSMTDRLCRWLSADGSSVLHVQPDLTCVILWLAGIALIGLALHSDKRKSLIPALTGSGCVIASLSLL